MIFLPVNLDALLVELDDLAQALALLDSLRREAIEGVEEIVPAARTLLLRYRPWVIDREALMRRIGARDCSAAMQASDTLIEIPVRYQGEDLDEVAAMLRIDREELIRRHTGGLYTVAFTGFAPGFAYLSGGDPTLDVPRRTTPRTRIPAGAVGLAGRFSGVYPTASPGGWQILGVTELPMWDLEREVPALLQPGFRVRFVDLDRREAQALPAALSARRPPREAQAGSGEGPEVVKVGAQAIFQDLGRPGLAGQGVSAGGAMDRAALRAANRLVGNVADAACVETVGAFELLTPQDASCAVTGADSSVELITPAGRRVELATHEAIALSAGDRLRIGEPRAGCRNYLAIRGGFVPEAVLGSRATDTLAKLGPAPIAAGDRLPVGSAPRGVVGAPETPPPGLPSAGQVITLDVVLGPRTDWFDDASIARLSSQLWTVTPQSNRVGLRLAGEQALQRLIQTELPSEGTAHGALQVPPSGQPVLFLADHPLTGGYPVIGAVASYHLDLAGQIPIGARLRFNPVRAFWRASPETLRESP